MGSILSADRRLPMVLTGTAAVGAIIFLTLKSGLLSSVAHWVLDYVGSCDLDPDELKALELVREEILDLDEDINTLYEKLSRTGYAPDRARILKDIATLESRKAELSATYGHCSGWGLH